ncbi:putative laccase-9 [Solanum stenotomum]|uniref:putative laccase-9 n=1 Tax=Solanum stenotomum TaxID=172797 RepID=UPI0020D0E59F|nr:putative laccase-9 [Solanum stenotomum]
MAFQKQAMKANTSLVLVIFFAVQYTASTQNNRSSIFHFVIEETSFDRLCQSKKILTVNGQFPGPTIYARAGETVVLDVENRGKDNVTIFCCKREGKHLKSDQVNWLIEPGFKVRKNITIFDKEGTLWWHAMNIWQSATIHGAFIVHSKPGTTYDIPIILGEWWKKDVKEAVLDYIDSGGDVNSDAFTVNGQPGVFYPCSNNGTFRIVVNTGKTYLLRVVNAAMSKTLYFGIARHNLTVVAMDGSPITKPFTTEYVKLSIQQSADCIFEANQQPDHYYMVAGTNVGQTHDMNKTTTAIIEYQGNYTPSSPPLLPLLPNLSPNYDKSSSRNYLNVIMTFVILGLLFCTALVVVWNRRPRRPHRSAMVAPL